MSSRVHIFLTQRARDEAVERIMASFLEAYQLRPVDRQEPNEAYWLSPAALPLTVQMAEPCGRPAGGESTERPESHGLLLGERLLLVCLAVLTALVVAGNLMR
jgi:hypothetical protein